MIIDRKNNIIVLYAEGTNKITNAKRTFFSNYIYVGKSDDPSNYEEVPKDVWRNFIEDVKTDIDTILESLESQREYIAVLEDCYIETDYRLTVHEIESTYGM